MEIKIKDFSGPLDLLLHLVSKYEVDIYDVPLVEVIEQYLDYIQTLQLLRLEVAGEYMVMASQLMLIKSRKLLPISTVTVVEEEDLEQELFDQLEEYAKYQTASQYLKEQHEKRAVHYSKPQTEIIAEDLPLLQDKTVIDLFLAFSKVMSEHQKKQDRPKRTLEAEEYRIEDKMAELETLLEEKEQVYFSVLFHEGTSRASFITSFLALLELMKRQFVRVEQDEAFGEILLVREKR